MGEVIAWHAPRKGVRRLYYGKLIALPATIVSEQRRRTLERHLPALEQLLKEANAKR
jgi:hypothetical protein